MKKIWLVPILLCTLIIAGCNVTGGISQETTRQNPDGSTTKTKVGVCGTTASQPCSIPLANRLLRSLSDLVASATGFSYSEWAGMDVSEYEIHINPDFGGVSTIDANQAIVRVYSAGSEVGSRVFSITKIGNIARFSSPSSVKSWSQQSVDIADNVVVEYETTTVNHTQDPITVQEVVKKADSVIASGTYGVSAGSGCTLGEPLPSQSPDICDGY